MPIQVSCECGKKLRVKDELAGKKVRCPGCQTIMPVPREQPEAAEPDEPFRTPPRTAAVRSRTAAPTRAQPESEVEEGEGPPAMVAPPRRQIVLRVIVLLLALLGGGASGFLGYKWYTDSHDPEIKAAIEVKRALIEQSEKVTPNDPRLQEEKTKIEKADKAALAAYILLAGALLGVLGGILAFIHMGKVAAPLMLLPPAGAGVLVPPSLVFTSPLILSGLLSPLIKSKPRANGGRRRVASAEDE